MFAQALVEDMIFHGGEGWKDYALRIHKDGCVGTLTRNLDA